MKEEFRARQKENPSGLQIADAAKRYGFVSVVAGEGLAALFRDLGAVSYTHLHLFPGLQNQNY